MVLLTPAGKLRRTPWKNGGGVTTELAVEPPGAGFDDCAWRLSIAEVTCDGPFSRFPGIERTLLLLDGAGMRLDIDGAVVTVQVDGVPCQFAGEASVHARLLDGPVRDANLMLRRPLRGALSTVCHARVTLATAAHHVCHVLAGTATVHLDAGVHPLPVGATLHITGLDAQHVIAVDASAADAVVLVASIAAGP